MSIIYGKFCTMCSQTGGTPFVLVVSMANAVRYEVVRCVLAVGSVYAWHACDYYEGNIQGEGCTCVCAKP